jgi:hypothetical protein
VEIIRSGITAGPPVEATYHIVATMNTTPDTIPPTAPRTTRPASGSGATSASAEDTAYHLLTSLHPTHTDAIRSHLIARHAAAPGLPRFWLVPVSLELAVPALCSG